MGQIYQPRDPSVAYQASQSLSNPGPQQAIDNSSKIAELGRQAGNYLGNYSQQALREQEFQSNALSRANEVNLQNTRNSIAAFQAAQQGDLAKAELMGRADLNNLALQNESQSRADRLALGSSELNSQLQLRNAAYLSNSVTNLGQALVGFSTTLWNKRVEQIDKENDALRVQGLTDYLNGNTGTLQADIAKVNVVETGRVIESGKANAAADSFEAAGRPNEAALIRSNNPFYLQGIQEATAIKAGMGYGTFLTNKIEESNLQKTKPGYQQELIALIDLNSKEYIKQQGLNTVNPAILAKYFGYEKAQTEAAIIARYNNQNNQAVKDTQLETAKSLAFNNYQVVSKLPIGQQQVEILKLVEANTQANSSDARKGQIAVLEQFLKAADSTGNFDLVDKFVNMDRGDGNPYGATPGMQELYVTGKRRFQQAEASFLDQQAKQQVDNIQGGWDAVIATGDVSQLRQSRDLYVNKALSLGTPEGNALAKEIATYNTDRSPLIDESVRRAIDGNYLPQFLRDNKGRMSKEQFDKLTKQSQQVGKLNDPSFKAALDTLKADIAFSAGEANKEKQGKGALPAYATNAVNAYVRIQQSKIEGFSKDWLIQNPNATSKDYQDWLKGQKPAYTHSWQYEINGESDMPKGMISLGQNQSNIPLVRNETIGGKTYLNLMHPKIQRGLADGSIPARSLVRSDSLVFTPQQIKQAGDQFEATGTWPAIVTDITSRSGNDALVLINAQAKLHRMPGSIVLPGNYSLPTSSSGQGVSYDAVVQFGKANRMSERGAITFATMVKDESSGNPRNVGDGGDSFGLMQWNNRYSPDRVKNLNAYAAKFGKPVTDPALQLNFALYEMKTFYPSAWEVLKSRNPTTNQLFRATVQYLGFDKSLEARRKASLEANLR